MSDPFALVWPWLWPFFGLFFFFYFDTEDATSAGRSKSDDSSMDVDEVIGDQEFLQSVLENLPGVDPQSDAIRSAVDSLNKDKKKDKADDKWTFDQCMLCVHPQKTKKKI